MNKSIQKQSPLSFSFLYIAKGSTGELRTQLQIAKEVGYLEKEEFERLRGRVEKVGGMIGNLIKVLKRGQ
jgi:four helix bundle protein